MFFMNEKALQQLDAADGFEVGVGPSVVFVDEGMAKQTTTTTMKDDMPLSSARKGSWPALASRATRSQRRT
jgi:hypothetical protein